MPKCYYDVYYQTATERNLVASISCEILQNDVNETKLLRFTLIKQYNIKGYGKPIIINLPRKP